ncbi:MAG: hypothetical protein PHH70_01980 [Candidatus Gracilibacteria bacterium]|nr:hypothetical protein [Candidatus Gracilibacteria bacterium]
MVQLEAIIAQIATALSITPLDVYVFFGVFIALIIFVAIGLTRIYSTFFGTVLGIGIYILFSTILSPELQTHETLSLISDTFAKVIIGSSVYLIFILTVLVPINGGVSVPLPKSPIGRIFQTFALSAGLILFLSAVLLGLIEKSYIFVHTDSAFALIKRFDLFSELQSSIFLAFVTAHLPTIIILSIGFIIYKMLFSEIIGAIIVSVLVSIKNRRSSLGDYGDHGDGGHEDFGGHDEMMLEDHEEHHGDNDAHGEHHTGGSGHH